jgi:hypothetical protein
MKPRVLLFYQTLVDLSPVLERPGSVTDIHLAAIHFGKDDHGELYIHLNNHWPDASIFDEPWAALEKAAYLGINVSVMIGGAGGGFETLLDPDHYCECFEMLVTLLKGKHFISGVNLDVEEYVRLDALRRLIRDLSATGITVSMSPLASSLTSDEPGMGGFSYKDLGKTKEGAMIAYLCGQFYGDISFDSADYQKAVKNGYAPHALVLGSLGPLDNHQLSCLQDQVDDLVKLYGDRFGGIFVWEYSLVPSFPSAIHF